MEKYIEEEIKLLKKAAEDGYEEAYRRLEEIKFMQQIENIKIGDCIMFGRYPQTDDRELRPIEWLVLNLDNNEALLVSKYVLDGHRPYHVTHAPVTWENCSLREWLNDEFFTKAFSEYEKNKIILTDVTADANTDHNTVAGNNTKDNVFLLSIKEVQKYFPNKGAALCYSTAYAEKMGAEPDYDGHVSWNLRSPGKSSCDVAYVEEDGVLHTEGRDVHVLNWGIRPAIYIKI